jgi:ribonuclease P protein component
MQARTPLNPLDLVVRQGVRISRPGFTVYSKALLGSHRPRIVVSHKVDKRATTRNLLRRRIRSILGRFPLKGVGIVIVCKPEILKLSSPELSDKLSSALNQLPWPKQ